MYKSEYVSVIIPIYNGEKYVAQCMECLLNQLYSKVEIIIVNDGSIDNTELLVVQYKDFFEKKGYIFKYLYQKNKGAASAVKYGLSQVTSEYIMLYDVDDILTKDAISEKAYFLNKNKDYDLVRNNGYYVDSKGYILNEFLTTENEKRDEQIFESVLKGETYNWAGSYMIRSKKLFDEIKDKNIYESRYGQNLQVLLPAARNAKAGYIDKYLMKYVQYDQSHSHSLNNRVDREYELLNGYEDIRLNILENLNMNEKEKQRYKRMIYISYLHKKIEFGYLNHRENIFFENFYKLKKESQCTKLEIKYYLLMKYPLINDLRKFIYKWKNIGN